MVNNILEFKDAREQSLLRRIALDKDQSALEDLYVIFRPGVCAFMRSVCNDGDAIDEAYNEVMYVVWNKAETFQGNSKVSSWIFGIAYRVSRDLSRKQQRFGHLVERFEDYMIDHPVDSNENEDHSVRQLVQHAMLSLSSKQKMVLELHHFMGFSVKEIAEITNAPVNTVKTRLHHARHLLRETVESLENEQAYESS